MKNIVIIGAGDLGKEIVWLIEDINKQCPTYVILGFLDDDSSKNAQEFFGYKVLGTTEYLDTLSVSTPVSAVIAIQDGATRRAIVEAHPHFSHWETIIHPMAVIAPESTLGEGSVLFPRVTVSVGTIIGRCSLLYINSTICNDCVIGDFTSIMTGTVVSEHSDIASGSFVPAGFCVTPHSSFPCDDSLITNLPSPEEKEGNQ